MNKILIKSSLNIKEKNDIKEDSFFKILTANIEFIENQINNLEKKQPYSFQKKKIISHNKKLKQLEDKKIKSLKNLEDYLEDVIVK